MQLTSKNPHSFRVAECKGALQCQKIYIVCRVDGLWHSKDGVGH